MVPEHAANGHNAGATPPPHASIWARLGRYNIVITLVLAFVGVLIGGWVSSKDSPSKEVALQWVGLPGDLFIRTLTALVLPMVFCNVSKSVADMVVIGNVNRIGWATIGLYLISTVVAAGLGFLSILSFHGMIEGGDLKDVPGNGEVSIGCSQPGFLLTEFPDGSLSCTNGTAGSPNNTFILNDLNSTFTKQSKGPPDDISLSDTIYDGIFTKLFTSNILRSFVDGDFAAVVMFSLAFGIAVSRVMRTPGLRIGYVLDLLKELDVILLFMLNWVISLTPVAVVSLIIKAIGSQKDVWEAFNQVVFLVIPAVLAMALQFCMVHVVSLLLIRRENPFNFLRYMLPAQTMAFATASSVATIPTTLQSLARSGVVHQTIANFVIPLGSTINMDGGAIYFPCACIWLAKINGEELTAAGCFLLVVIATIGSIGTAPVPSGSLALILTAYNTVFDNHGTARGFELIVAIDWMMDRFRTVLNVTGDGVVSALVAHVCPLPQAPQEGVRFVPDQQGHAERLLVEMPVQGQQLVN